MRHSLNEIEVTLRKAGVGAGISVGLSEEVGRAAGWLAARQLDGASAGLLAVRGGLSACDLTQGEGDCATFNGASVAVAGPSAFDVLAAGAAQVRLTGMDSPLLLVGLAGVAATDRDQSFELHFANGQVIGVSPEGASGLEPGALGSDVTVRISASAKPADTVPPNAKGIEVSDTDWQEISALAAKTYVPESDASRDQGAGAGSIDND